MKDINAAYQEAKSLPRESLEGELRSPSGAIPEFIILSELNDRSNIQGKRKPNITVKDEMMMGLGPPASTMPTQGFAEGGAVEAYYNPYLGMDAFGGMPQIAELLANMQSLKAKNQPEPQRPSELQPLEENSGITQLGMLSEPPELKAPVRFANGGVVGGHQSMTDEELRLLAIAMHAEGGNQTPEGRGAIVRVILRRVEDPRYPNTVKGVLMQPGQFSYNNDLTGYAGGKGGNPSGRKLTAENLKLAQDVAAGRGESRTGNATHYYNPDIATPKWGRKSNNDPNWTRIGDHIFGTADAGQQMAQATPRARPTSPPSGRSLPNPQPDSLTDTQEKDAGLATILASMAEQKRELMPKRDLTMTRASYADEDRSELEELIKSLGSGTM